jgi:glycosyltransferase involved in cell wall biosynthesis
VILSVVLEQRFDRTPEGAVWTPGAFALPFWTRYLEVFDGLRVVARMRDVPAPPLQQVRADGPGVQFAAVPYYIGPWQYLLRRKAVRAAVHAAVGAQDAVIMRVGSQLANCLYPRLRRAGRPYGLEVVGDPWDVFSQGAVRHPLRPFFRRYFTGRLKQQCAHACAAAYVTEHTLQKRYPLQRNGYATSYSSVELSLPALSGRLSVGVSDVDVTEESFAAGRAGVPREKNCVRLIFVGSLAQMYKAPDVLLEAMAQCASQGLDLHLTMIGEGCCRKTLESLASRLGLTNRVVFRGQLPAGNAIREELDQADLFVLPSRTEGLPRAMIEAMARALPCIGSAVGGIPELLPDEDLVPPGSATALAQKIREVAADPLRMLGMAARNLKRAYDFRDDILRERRLKFYRFVREHTEHWLQTGALQ